MFEVDQSTGFNYCPICRKYSAVTYTSQYGYFAVQCAECYTCTRWYTDKETALERWKGAFYENN